MAFTMHSHSGQFCPGHAQDQLEDIVKHAIAVGFRTMGLSEHMPRLEVQDLYPEEMTPSPARSLAALRPMHAAYLAEARRLQGLYAAQIEILIGFETEFIRPGPYLALVRELSLPACVDYVVGSVHHVGGVPIDYDEATYASAVRRCGGGGGNGGGDEEEDEVALWREYFLLQGEMLRAVRPKVVGHFDVVRLLSRRAKGRGRVRVSEWEEEGQEGRRVWELVRENLEVVRGYGGLLECNSSALRKGLEEPYPARDIAEEWLRMGGRFTMSDDSHGVGQVATHYLAALDYLESLGVEELWTFERKAKEGAGGDGKAELLDRSVSLREFRESLRLA